MVRNMQKQQAMDKNKIEIFLEKNGTEKTEEIKTTDELVEHVEKVYLVEDKDGKTKQLLQE